ncbi:MAG: type II toxin-antitoxin system VapB family antitoxin [Dehalococcoidia bacterium]|nr:type II toxin-antitoxin system VapB family antitoxin [Dehalococcoidia bacterium]
MRTTLNIDPKLLEKVVAITGERNKGKAVDRAMDEFLRRKAVEKLLAARGKFRLHVKHEEWEEADLKVELEHKRSRRWSSPTRMSG